MPNTRYLAAALSWQAALAAYMQLISWVPLGKWNYQPCCPTGLQLIESAKLTASEAATLGSFLLPFLVFVAAAVRRSAVLAWLSTLSLAVWLGLQLATWWPPYILGASEKWQDVYERAFAQATQLLPRVGNHLPPDAMHLALQALLLGSVVASAIASWRLRKGAA